MVTLSYEAYPENLGVLTDDAAGMHDTDIVYNDCDVEQLSNIPRTQPHREVDLAVLAADQEGGLQHVVNRFQARSFAIPARICQDIPRVAVDNIWSRYRAFCRCWHHESTVSTDPSIDYVKRGPQACWHGG